MELARVTKTSLDISTEVEVLAYTYSGTAPIEVQARVDLGDVSKPIVGGGNYEVYFYLDGVKVVPAGAVTIQPGQTRAILVCRSVPLEAGDVVSVRVRGLGGDTSINSVSTLRDVSAVKVSDVAGVGPVQVDHNYGSADRLAYKTSGGLGIVGATIRVYNTADYDAGNRSAAYVVAMATTTALGRWARPVMLAPGSYTLVYYLTNAYGPDVHTIVVA